MEQSSQSIYERFAGSFGARASGEYGGCSTCGHGAVPVMDDGDFKKLLADIDEFVGQNFTSKVKD